MSRRERGAGNRLIDFDVVIALLWALACDTPCIRTDSAAVKRKGDGGLQEAGQWAVP